MKHFLLSLICGFSAAVLCGAEVGAEWLFKFDGSLKPEDARRISSDGIMPPGSIPFRLGGKYSCIDLHTLQKKYIPVRDAGIAFGTITAEKAGKYSIGIGCDWWFTCYINGEPAGSTEPKGNGAAVISPYHHRYTVDLKQGKNLVAVHMRPGTASWGFAFALLPDFRNWPQDQSARKLLFNEMFPEGEKAQETGGPVVSKVSVSSAVITLAFDPPAAAYLRFRETGADRSSAKEIMFRKEGLLDARKIHRFELTGLKENTRYSYETFFLNEFSAKMEPCGSGEFTTFPLNGDRHSFAVFSDTQVSEKNRMKFFRDCLDNHLLDGAFYASLGDMASDFRDFFRIYFTSSLNILRYPAQKNTFVAVRGNHEYRGKENGMYTDAFGRSYCHFIYGDTIYIVLDTGEDKAPVLEPGHYTLRHDLAYFFREQAAWFKTLTETPDFRNAKHRIVLAHAPPFECMDSFKYAAKNIRGVVGAYFYGENPQYKLDLWICGHMHSLMYSDPVSKTLNFIGGKGRRIELSGADREICFPVFVNDGSGMKPERLSVTRVDVLPDCLELRVFRSNGVLLKAIRLRPRNPVEIMEPQ